jgi:hypothetical protein
MLEAQRDADVIELLELIPSLFSSPSSHLGSWMPHLTL